MEQSYSSEANSHLASQEISRCLWNSLVHYHVHKIPPLFPVLSQMYPFHSFPTYFPKIHPDSIFPSTPRSSKWFLPFKFSNQNILYTSHPSYPRYMPSQTHPSWFDDPDNILCMLCCSVILFNYVFSKRICMQLL